MTDEPGPLASSGSARRRELLSVALQVFASKGYSASTVRDIADAAGILSGSLYHHFRSKDKILDEILRDFLTRLLVRSRAIVAEAPDVGVALRTLVADVLDTIDREPQAVMLYQYEAVTVRQSADFEDVREMSRELEALWVEVLQSGRDEGLFRHELDPWLAYRFIRDAVWSTVRWYRAGERLDIGSVRSQYIELLQRGLFIEAT